MLSIDRNPSVMEALDEIVHNALLANEMNSDIGGFAGHKINRDEEKYILSIYREYGVKTDGLQYGANILTSNPYFANIRLHNINYNSIRCENVTLPDYRLIDMDFPRSNDRLMFRHRVVGYFKESIKLPVLKQEGKVWMSPSVSEINSMQDGVDKGTGNCLTYGLGLGVLPYMWVLKPEVKSVTIVECNQDVIDIFNNYIKPQFNTDKPIEIIRGNAYDYFNEDFINKFDYTYVDFWENNTDGLECYMKLMETYYNDNPSISYWIEDAILYDAKFIMLPYIKNIAYHVPVSDFISSLTELNRDIAIKINRFFKSKDINITTEEELRELFEDKVMKEILAYKTR